MRKTQIGDWEVSTLTGFDGEALETVAFEDVGDKRQVYVYAPTHAAAVRAFGIALDTVGADALPHLGYISPTGKVTAPSWDD